MGGALGRPRGIDTTVKDVKRIIFEGLTKQSFSRSPRKVETIEGTQTRVRDFILGRDSLYGPGPN